jgi:PLP dependent protein
MADVGGNYRKLVERIDEAAAKSGREASAIKLLAAAKSQRIEAIRAALAAGVTLIGENYAQEADEKKKEISTLVEWHMIGHLQRNKVRLAVELFDVIESLDNLALARELDKEGRRRGKIIRAFAEINLGGEESKSGIAKNHVASLLESVAKLANLRVEGLMTVPPFRQDPEQVRPFFRELRDLKEELSNSGFPNVDLKELSMGMTHDYPVAIEEGATIVRIGTALFGPRT